MSLRISSIQIIQSCHFVGAPLVILVSAFAFIFAGFRSFAYATTKGLNQIITPDVQPEGDLSLSFQWQGKEIANPYEFQAELGITRGFEVAVFQGIKPSETIFGCEIALVQKDPWLLTAGCVATENEGRGPRACSRVDT